MKSHNQRHCLISLLWCFLLFFANADSLFAQDLDEVTIRGKITDERGAALPGAIVTAILVSNNQERTATTNTEGRYLLIELKPGVYVLRIKAAGFANLEQKDLNTLSGDNLQLNYVLTPAAIRAETVVVDETSAPAVDTTRTVVGGTITEREIEELPNLNRNPFDLIFTLGGVTEEPLSTRDLAEDKGTRGQSAPERTPEEAGIFALSGGAAYSNNITIDGVDNNDDRAATFRFHPSIETVAEVQVVTNQFSAEYGRASGGRVNIRTRAGGKNFRGRLFYFFRDESLNANTNRNKARGIARPALQDNNPGFTFGGPMPFGYFKNRTFFFVGYEYDNIDENTVIDTYVPVNQNARFPLPAPTNLNQTANDGGVLIAPYSEAVKTPLREHIFSARVDHNFNDSHSITIAFQRGTRRDFRQFSGGNRLAEALVGSSRNSDALGFTDNFIFSPKIVNQFRVQYSELKPAIIADSGLESPVVIVNLPSVINRGSSLVAGSSTSNSSDRRELRTQFQNTLTAIFGSQSLHFGADVQRIKSAFTDRFDATGTFRFDTANDFLQSRVFRYTQVFGSRSTQRNTYTGIFAQDDVRVRSNLTVSAGLRYERETIIDDENNFSPRFAIAYDPFKSGKDVIRFGAGIFYNRALLRTIDDFSLGKSQIEFDTNNVPSGAQRQVVLDALSGQFPQALTSDNQFVQQYGRTNSGFSRRLDSELEVPESYQANLGFEREIAKGFVVEANLTVNKTVKLWRDVSVNAPRVPAGFRDLAEYLLSRPFNNARDATGNRPLYNVANARDVIRFATSYTTPPVGSPSRCAGNNSTPANSEQGGCLVINGVPTTIINLNSQSATNASPPITIALAAVQNLRPDPTRTQVEQLSSIGSSFYRGLTLELRKRFSHLSHGFAATLRAVYTLSSLKDDGIVNTSSAQVQGNFEAEFSRSLLDRRHRFAFSGTFDTPLWLGKIRLSPIVRFLSGAPFNLSAGGIDRNLDDVNNDRPNFSGNLSDIRSRKSGEPFPQNVFNALTRPLIGSSGGDLPRNAGSGPGQAIFDLNLSRPIKLSEHISLRPTLEINNVFNSTGFSFGTAFINATDPQTTFLVPQRTLRPRLIRVGIRFDF
ncbi:MAG: TonB-dependent receptor [Pyrinomonadaceae bacterium]